MCTSGREPIPSILGPGGHPLALVGSGVTFLWSWSWDSVSISGEAQQVPDPTVQHEEQQSVVCAHCPYRVRHWSSMAMWGSFSSSSSCRELPVLECPALEHPQRTQRSLAELLGWLLQHQPTAAGQKVPVPCSLLPAPGVVLARPVWEGGFCAETGRALLLPACGLGQAFPKDQQSRYLCLQHKQEQALRSPS